MGGRKKRHSKICPCDERIETRTRYFHALVKKLKKARKSERVLLLRNSDPCFIRYLGHCAKGILSSTIHLPENTYKRLSGVKNLLVKLASNRLSVDKKRKHLLTQKGGAFPVLIPILANIATAVVSGLIEKAVGRR